MLIEHTKTLSRPWGALALSLALVTILNLTAAAAKYPTSAPDFTLPDLEGRQIALQDLSADNVILFFGATWCPHCDDALPIISRFSGFLDSAQLEIVFISVREKNADVARFAEKKSLPCKILLDKTGITARAYQAPAIPTCVFLDADRQIQFIGKPNEDIIWRLLSGERPILNEPTANRLGPRAAPAKAKPATPGDRKRFIVELDEHPALSKRLSKAARAARADQYSSEADAIGARIIHNYGKLKNKIVVEIPENRADQLAKLPGFKSLKQDRPVHALLEDSAYQIRADYAWENAITGQGVRVCVIDTGIDYLHPDLINKIVAQYDATTGLEDCMDDNGHGTHVAGIIASEGLQYRGVSFDASLMGAKVLDYSGNGYGSDVVLGINWCVDNGADVINLSLGEGSYSDTCDFEEMAQAVNAAADAGVVVACASGNDGDPLNIVAPACASKAIAVGSVDKIDGIASYSDGGIPLDLVAPGGGEFGGSAFPEIVSCYSTLLANDPFFCLYMVGDDCYDSYFVVDGTRYIRAVGTSMAAPHVAAAAALLLEENSELTPAQVQTVLQENADDLGQPGWDNIFGHGRINLERALENIPAEPSQLIVNISEPNAVGNNLPINQPLNLAADIECLGGDGCGNVTVHAQFCPGLDCDNFVDINEFTPIATVFDNPNDLGVLSGCTVETQAPLMVDIATTLDLSEGLYSKTTSPAQAIVGSELPGEYSTGDLEPGDGLVFAEGNEKLYDFELPQGNIKKISVRLENYLIVHFNEITLSSWSVYTANAAGDNLHLIDTVIPAEGGGGEPAPPDCWFVTEDPAVIADFTAGATSYINLVANDVDDYDWLTFNDIEVIVEYQIDPNNDTVGRYSLKFDLSSVDTTGQLGSALLKINIAAPAQGAVAELHLIDPAITTADAPDIHESNEPDYSSLINPIKTFSAESTGLINLNVKAAIAEALDNGQTSIAFQIRERNQDQLVTLDAAASPTPPTLTISQTLQQGCPGQTGQPASDPNNGPKPVNYDTLVVKDVSEASYSKFDDPNLAIIGAEFAAEYSTGDLEPGDGLVFAEGNEKLYEFELPEGIISKISVRLENYLIVHFNEITLSSWSVYTANDAGDNLHLIDTVIPAEGGGGEPAPPDCWFITEDTAIIADFAAGATSYIKLTANDVDDYDWLTFNDIEVIVEYQVDPNNDNVSRYYVKFDISSLTPGLEVDSAHLNFNVETPAPDAVALVNLVNSTYSPSTGALTIFNIDGPDYSSLTNPVRSFNADTPGPKKANVKAALEDAVESGVSDIAFLITEKEEDTIFSLDTAASQNPPTLDVYLKSSISGAAARWTITPTAAGPHTIRVLAQNDVGIVGVSDEKVLNIVDPNLPTINSVQCLIDSTWQSCANAAYNDTIEAIRIDAHDSQGRPLVRARITNIPDNHDFLNSMILFDGQYFTRTLDLTITDSGDWRIEVTCTDTTFNVDTETINWFIPWGSLVATITEPAPSVTVPKGDSFALEATVECLEAECPETNLSLQINTPVNSLYDDGTAEDYGDLGSTDSYIAVKFTPDSYPAQLRTARFYVWDKTTYPFELNVWDDNGFGGVPNTQLITPFVVDPVASSSDEVAWFDIDLTGHNIVIQSGDFYIGWRQIAEGKLNQVGFDTTGTREKRTWGYVPLFGGWLNLDDLCLLSPDVCGNIMIRATMSEPGTFAGPMPPIAAPAPLYCDDNHPRTVASMTAGQQHDAVFTVRAVGAPDQTARIDLLASNVQSFDSDGPLRVTITDPRSQCHAANLDAAGAVDFKDLAVLLAHFTDNTTPMPADINNDNATDAEDLAQIADFWLTNCD